MGQTQQQPYNYWLLAGRQIFKHVTCSWNMFFDVHLGISAKCFWSQCQYRVAVSKSQDITSWTLGDLGKTCFGQDSGQHIHIWPKKWNNKHGMKCPSDHTGSWIVRKSMGNQTMAAGVENSNLKIGWPIPTEHSPNKITIKKTKTYVYFAKQLHQHIPNMILNNNNHACTCHVLHCCLWQYDETTKPGWTVWKTHHCEIIFGWFVHWGWLRRWARRSTKPCLIIWCFRWCFMGIPREHLRLNDIFSKRKARLVIHFFGRNNA